MSKCYFTFKYLDSKKLHMSAAKLFEKQIKKDRVYFIGSLCDAHELR